jgi:hypothetical protein
MNWLSRLLPGSGPALNPEQQTALDSHRGPARPIPAARTTKPATWWSTPKPAPWTAAASGCWRWARWPSTRACCTPATPIQARLGGAPVDALIGLCASLPAHRSWSSTRPSTRAPSNGPSSSNLGSQPELDWIDLMVLMPSLYPERIAGQARMDAWLGAFGIDRLDHRDALLEALALPSCSGCAGPGQCPGPAYTRGICSTPRAAASGCGAVEPPRRSSA